MAIGYSWSKALICVELMLMLVLMLLSWRRVRSYLRDVPHHTAIEENRHLSDLTGERGFKTNGHQ
jgi:hypothetical protein